MARSIATQERAQRRQEWDDHVHQQPTLPLGPFPSFVRKAAMQKLGIESEAEYEAFMCRAYGLPVPNEGCL